MTAICDMALGRLADRRYFLGIVHDGIKTGFMRKKEALSYIRMVFIACCLLDREKEMCNLFRTCLYFEEDILNQNR